MMRIEKISPIYPIRKRLPPPSDNLWTGANPSSPPRELYAAISNLISKNTDAYGNAMFSEAQIEAEFRAHSLRYPSNRPVPKYWIGEAIISFRKAGWHISLSPRGEGKTYSFRR